MIDEISDKSFIDTNILVYAFETGESEKKRIASKLYLLPEIFISNQVISEFSFVLLRKAKLSPKIVHENIKKIISLNSIKIINYTDKTVIGALILSEKQNLHFWDALIAQTAIENGISTIYTENAEHFKDLPIRNINPFIA